MSIFDFIRKAKSTVQGMKQARGVLDTPETDQLAANDESDAAQAQRQATKPQTKRSAALGKLNDVVQNQGFSGLTSGGGIGAAADLVSSFIPHKPQSDTTEKLNGMYDKASDIAMKINPAVGAIAKVGGMVSDGLTAMGVGTDQMTKFDQIADSKFFKLTPMGLINAFGAKKSDTILKDSDSFDELGSSYDSSEEDVDKSLEKSGKKFGLFSNRGRKRANRIIREAKRQQSAVRDISDQATFDRLSEQSMSDIYANRNQFESQGGYNNRMQVGKQGLKFPKKKLSYEEWVKTVPSDRVSKNYDLETAYKVLPIEELELWRNATPQELKSGQKHLRSVYELPNGDYEFLKLGNELENKEIMSELQQFDAGKTGLERSHYLVFDKDNNRYYYRKFSQEKFKEGGKMNVIPEGALHARLNHLDIDDVTKKGIPVIIKNGDKVEQQAEVECNEIIFTKEVTDKLEQLCKDGSDESAIEAGKILVKEILENTKDNTGLIEKTN